MRFVLPILILFISCNLFAQPYAGKELAQTAGLDISKAANCTPPTASTTMELNNVRFLVHTAGNLWQIPGQNLAQYEVPKNSGIMALFTSALWLGGTDINGQLKLAALRYRNGQDYWTGPLSQGPAETTWENCNTYDKHFITVQDEIRLFDAWFTAGMEDAANGTNLQSELFQDYEIPDIIKEWPAHGDITQGQDYYLAPFFDRNEDGEYRWEDGDYPWHDIYKTKACETDRTVSLYGDLNYWWVMNDKGNIHTETGADPIGMEIRAQAFAFSSNDEINNMTFYNYELINRGTQTLYDTYFGYFTDGALGDPLDDYVGCDVSRGLAYYYNGDNYDGDNAGWLGYGSIPPAVGVDFFEGPYQDNDGIDNAYGIGPNEALNGIGYGDGVIDNERFGMRQFLYYSNTTLGANPSQTDPVSAADYYSYLQGYWKDGTSFFYGGTGHISDAETDPTVPCDFMFPGDTDPLGWGTGGNPQAPWTEQTSNNPPNDRRFVQSAGPFVLTPGAVNNITVGVVWARATSGGPFASVEVLRRADDKAQALFENCFRVLDAPHAPNLSIQELENELILTLSNSSSSNNFNEGYVEFDPLITPEDSLTDKYYRFQGYQIYQLKQNDVALSDIQDVSKARLVAQCDIEDGIGRIINFEFDEDLGASVAVERVDGADEGIQHSFSIKEDEFAQGDKELVNFKRYYYIAIAYAHNEYEKYDPTDPLALNGQKKSYIASRKAAIGEVKVVEAIPHNPTPEADGTSQNIEYGSSPIIRRMDGYGNGNRAIELTDASKAYIVQNGFMEKPEYTRGNGPIHVKIVDPLNVTDGYFECEFVDYTPTNFNGVDTASWLIKRYDTENGILLETYSSERTIASNNEQIIPELGISVQIKQQKYTIPNGVNGAQYTTEMISSELNFSDSSKQWMSFISDNDGFFPTNWIRSGTYSPETDANDPGYECLDQTSPSYRDYLDPCNYPDWGGTNNFIDPDKTFSKLLGGGIAPHALTGFEGSYMPMAYYNYGTPTSAKNASSLSFLPSVDIVITSDKAKWTRCPVIETGRIAALNINGALPGQMRKSPSVDKNGQPDNSSTTGMGWFPGYAIDVESGARLYMAFGENSFLVNDNGGDMIWNPSEKLVDSEGAPVMGGVQPFYVFSYQTSTINNYIQGFDFSAYIPDEAENELTNLARMKLLEVEADNNAAKRQFYGSLSWIGYPLLRAGRTHMESDVTIRLRVNKEYKEFVATNDFQGRPAYSWNMSNITTEKGLKSQLVEALEMINVVPNPYKAYSEYERNRIDSRIKITNLPERCTIKIYSVNGKLIKTFNKDNPSTYQDWLLINNKGIAVSSGVYLIHVKVPGVGDRIIKSFVAMRQVDLNGT
jgi:hypothetical protein